MQGYSEESVRLAFRTKTCAAQRCRRQRAAITGAAGAIRKLLWEEHRTELEAATEPVRRYYKPIYAPWFDPEPDGQANADARRRGLELVHGRRRFPSLSV